MFVLTVGHKVRVDALHLPDIHKKEGTVMGVKKSSLYNGVTKYEVSIPGCDFMRHLYGYELVMLGE